MNTYLFNGQSIGQQFSKIRESTVRTIQGASKGEITGEDDKKLVNDYYRAFSIAPINIDWENPKSSLEKEGQSPYYVVVYTYKILSGDTTLISCSPLSASMGLKVPVRINEKRIQILVSTGYVKPELPTQKVEDVKKMIRRIVEAAKSAQEAINNDINSFNEDQMRAIQRLVSESKKFFEKVNKQMDDLNHY